MFTDETNTQPWVLFPFFFPLPFKHTITQRIRNKLDMNGHKGSHFCLVTIKYLVQRVDWGTEKTRKFHLLLLCHSQTCLLNTWYNNLGCATPSSHGPNTFVGSMANQVLQPAPDCPLSWAIFRKEITFYIREKMYERACAQSSLHAEGSREGKWN